MLTICFTYKSNDKLSYQVYLVFVAAAVAHFVEDVVRML